MTSLTVLPFSHPYLKWCTPDGVWLSHEEAADWTPLPPVSSEDGAE
jgi:hypothetical protein